MGRHQSRRWRMGEAEEGPNAVDVDQRQRRARQFRIGVDVSVRGRKVLKPGSLRTDVGDDRPGAPRGGRGGLVTNRRVSAANQNSLT